MKKEIAAAAIACDYVGIYKKCNPEPSYDLWIVASEISRNPWFREDQERRGREMDVEVEYGGMDDVAYAELAKTMEMTIIDEFDEHKTCRDGIEKRTIPRREDWEKIFDTNLVQRKVWDGIGKVSQDDRFVR